MPACVFGCDALFETGFVGVGDDGFLVFSLELEEDVTLSLRGGALKGKRCNAHSPLTANLFRWHRQHVLCAQGGRLAGVSRPAGRQGDA